MFVEQKCSVPKLDCHTVCSCLDAQKELWLCALIAGKCEFQMDWNMIAMFKYNIRKPELNRMDEWQTLMKIIFKVVQWDEM